MLFSKISHIPTLNITFNLYSIAKARKFQEIMVFHSSVKERSDVLTNDIYKNYHKKRFGRGTLTIVVCFMFLFHGKYYIVKCLPNFALFDPYR